ncbi:SUMF1/EgtB/PvdO family nonheme iron enzyme [Polyangium aurulentum]|uniref:SUMF1/EgtB/PvdO family nonheme iron enzyme n=1 Tax=Polyangium aurulentum TaxID=2567896 RepID=UPI0010AEC194|nr:SUMF1/EgtB/PvdO family nonheme iron enzyme [Polyangium aurulentum]UQA57401.1 SUMF1/EgtB/PvdO family nonheme iron enzyme [Polyangium aurulentum]
MKAWAVIGLALLVGACVERKPEPAADAGPEAGADGDAGASAKADAGADAADLLAPRPDDFEPLVPEGPSCPPDMVRVARRFCVDRYEASLVDAETGQELSPYYVPARGQALSHQKLWEQERLNVGPPEARLLELPPLPAWQATRTFEPRAVSRRGRIPQGYMTGPLAALACKNAGKRLCALDEWQTACRGQKDRQFPYGDKYEPGKCNIFREAHPAALLHGNASIGHSDPRLNLVKAEDKPLLRRTGETRSCVSEWEGEKIADMVGNIDEWVDDPEGTFAGGFYARSKKDGCDSTVRAHPFDYFDYSTGVRCCMDLPTR